MTLEFDNMRTAWDWGIRREKFELIGRAVRSFGWYFEVAGLIYDGIDQLDLLVQVLSDKPRDKQMDKALGSTLVQQGLLCFRSGQFARAQELYQNAIDILRSVGEQALLADALILSGTLIYLTGDYLEARELIEEGLSYARAANDPWFTAYGIYNLGLVDSRMGEYQKGYEQMQEGLALWRMLGDPHSISLGLNFFVETQIKLGRCEEAITSMQESIALCERTKNRWGMGTAYRYLGLATLASGRYVEARGHLQKSLEIFGEYFKGWDIARSLIYLADAVFMVGDLKEAEKSYLDVLRLAVEVKSTPVALDAVVGLARVYLCHGEGEKAFELANFVLNQAASTQETKEISRQLIFKAEKQLGDDRMQAIREKTLDQSLEVIAEMCLKQRQPGQMN
jgi:tetratricopeptide (TPR) repeat protein